MPKFESFQVEKLNAVSNVPDVTVYEHHNCNTGENDRDGWSFRTSLACKLLKDDANDSISSVIVHSGTWRFFEHGNFTGASFDLAAGYHNNLPNGWNDRITSFKPVSY